MVTSSRKNNFLSLFGKRLRLLRTDKNLSFRQLAQNCNLDYSDISKIEKGERNIQLSTIYELAKGLGLHPKELFCFEIDIDSEQVD